MADLVQTCSKCIKYPIERGLRLVPLVRSLKRPHPRSVIGLDAVDVLPVHLCCGEPIHQTDL